MYKYTVTDDATMLAYYEDDEDIPGWACFENFKKAKAYLENLLEHRYEQAKNMKAKDVTDKAR